MKNHFAVLEVNKHSTDVEIREARKGKAFKLHPDLGGDPEKMLEVNEAFRVLTERRLWYTVMLTGFPICHSCGGEGVHRKQKGFTNSVITTCSTCKGAGATGLE